MKILYTIFPFHLIRKAGKAASEWAEGDFNTPELLHGEDDEIS